MDVSLNFKLSLSLMKGKVLVELEEKDKKE